MPAPATPLATSPCGPYCAKYLFWVQNESPLSSRQNNETVVDTGQEFGRHLGKGRRRLKSSAHCPVSLCLRLSEQELKQREGGDSAAVWNAHYASSIRRWSPTHGKDAVIVWEWVRPQEKICGMRKC